MHVNIGNVDFASSLCFVVILTVIYIFLSPSHSTSGLPPATSPPAHCAEKPSSNTVWWPRLDGWQLPNAISQVYEELLNNEICLIRLHQGWKLSKRLSLASTKIFCHWNSSTVKSGETSSRLWSPCSEVFVYSSASTVCRASLAPRWC